MRTSTRPLGILLLLALVVACAKSAAPNAGDTQHPAETKMADSGSRETVALGAGCYWCIEAVLEQVEGVVSVRSGFMGGSVANPTYEQVCDGITGHAEVVEVTFDPARLSFDDLLDWFWRLHDPTTLNRQGADVGTQYRSAIFYATDEQRDAAKASKQAAQASFDRPIVTEITKASTFYPANESHQEYYRNNRSQPYCQMVIRPKLKKLGLQD